MRTRPKVPVPSVSPSWKMERDSGWPQLANIWRISVTSSGGALRLSGMSWPCCEEEEGTRKLSAGGACTAVFIGGGDELGEKLGDDRSPDEEALEATGAGYVRMPDVACTWGPPGGPAGAPENDPDGAADESSLAMLGMLCRNDW